MSVTLSELLQDLYGVKSVHKINSVTDNVDTTLTKILNANPNRLSFLVLNLSGNSVYIAPDSLVSTTRGIYLASNGGSFIAMWDRDFELVSQEWYAVATANNSAILILENISI